MYEEISDDEYMDTEWINKLEVEEKHYDIFYNTEIKTINLFFIFIDKSNKIFKIRKDKYNLNKMNILSQGELIRLLKNEISNSILPVKLSFMLKYNNLLSPEDIINNKNIKKNYLETVNSIKDIEFIPTIELFNDLNTLYIGLSEKITSNTTTKKIKYNYINSKFKKSRKR
jgi:hypothetical protein